MEVDGTLIPSKRPHGDAEAMPHVPKRSRGRTGCLNCRKRRKKCDETKPSCNKCSFRGEECEWDTGLTFRSIGIDSSHPSMLQASGKTKSRAQLKIVDVKFDKPTRTPPTPKRIEAEERSKAVPRSIDNASNEIGDRLPWSDPALVVVDASVSSVTQLASSLKSIDEGTCSSGGTSEPCESESRPPCQRFPYEEANPDDCIPDDSANSFECAVQDDDEQMQDCARSNSDTCSTEHLRSESWSGEQSGSSATSISSLSAKHGIQQHDAGPAVGDGLTYVDALTPLLRKGLPKDDCTTARFQLPPGAMRLRLHRKVEDLAESMRAEQRHADMTVVQNASALQSLSFGTSGPRGIRLVQRPLTARPLGCTRLDKRRQLELWSNFIHNVAPWLDACGSRRHFQHTLPLLAKSADCLHYATLALSARQLELRQGPTPEQESIDLHDDAARLLIPALQTLEVTAIVAYVLLCICDLMTYPFAQFRRGLETCALLLDLAGIDSTSNGFSSSLFWLVASLSTRGSFDQLQEPTLSIHQYHPSDALAGATSYIRSQTWGEGYSKYAIYLTSLVNSVVSTGIFENNRKHSVEELNHWNTLHSLVEDWYNCRPEEMQALMSYPSILDDQKNRFPMLLYSSTGAILGNLLYHSASILLLRSRPSLIELPKNCKSLMWHARQICGILNDNHEKGVWPCATQPLLLAGKTIVNSAEREKIVEMLEFVQHESGWTTTWYIHELRTEWSLA